MDCKDCKECNSVEPIIPVAETKKIMASELHARACSALYILREIGCDIAGPITLAQGKIPGDKAIAIMADSATCKKRDVAAEVMPKYWALVRALQKEYDIRGKTVEYEYSGNRVIRVPAYCNEVMIANPAEGDGGA